MKRTKKYSDLRKLEKQTSENFLSSVYLEIITLILYWAGLADKFFDELLSDKKKNYNKLTSSMKKTTSHTENSVSLKMRAEKCISDEEMIRSVFGSGSNIIQNMIAQNKFFIRHDRNNAIIKKLLPRKVDTEKSLSDEAMAESMFGSGSYTSQTMKSNLKLFSEKQNQSEIYEHKPNWNFRNEI